MRRLALGLLCLFAAACLPAVHDDGEPLPAAGRLLEGSTVWSGEVRIAGPVTVPRGSTLVIEGGTEVRFAPGPGGEPASLTILGDLRAEGTSEAPILLAAEGSGGPESWEGVRLDYVDGFLLRWVEIRDARYALHAHFSSGEVDHVRLTGSLEGARIGRSRISFTGCLVDGNVSKGLSMTDSSNSVSGCTITRNRYGVFLFEGSRGDRFEGNNLVGNELFDLRLGDFFSGGIALKGNWWGPAGREVPRIDPPPADGGPVDGAPSPVPFPDGGFWREEGWWPVGPALEMGGFTDAAPALDGRMAFGGSWEGRLLAFDPATGAVAWSANVGAPIDATPVVAGDLVIVPAWDRTVRAFDRRDGTLRWSFTWPSSGFDDHRQGSPVLFGEAVVVPAWNGILYGLDQATGRLLWEREVGGALRARPLVSDGMLVAGSDHGTIVACDATGKLLWTRALGAGARGTPLAAGGRIVLTLRDGRVTALSRETGATAWERPPGAGFEYASPVLFRESIVTADTAGNLSLLSVADGALSLVIPLGSPLYATPAVVGGLLVVGDTVGWLRAIDPATGLVLRRIDLGGPIQATPVVAGNHLIVGSRAGRYHLLSPP